jgi:hypothetical protein
MLEFIRYLENEDRVGRKEQIKAGHEPGHALRVRRSPAEFKFKSSLSSFFLFIFSSLPLL